MDRLKERIFARRKAEADANAKPMPAGPKPMPAVPKPAGPMPVGPKPMPAGPKPAGPQVKAMPKVPKAPQPVPKAKAADVSWFLHNSTVVIESVSDEEPPPNQVALPRPRNQQQYKTLEAALKRQRRGG